MLPIVLLSALLAIKAQCSTSCQGLTSSDNRSFHQLTLLLLLFHVGVALPFVIQFQVLDLATPSRSLFLLGSVPTTPVPPCCCVTELFRTPARCPCEPPAEGFLRSGVSENVLVLPEFKLVLVKVSTTRTWSCSLRKTISARLALRLVSLLSW